MRTLKGEKETKSVWMIEGRINCRFDIGGHEVRKVIESPNYLFKLGWTEAKIAGLNHTLTCKTGHFLIDSLTF